MADARLDKDPGYPRCVVFGDESTVPRLRDMLGNSATLAVVAAARPQSRHLCGPGVAMQPRRDAPGYGPFFAMVKDLQPDLILSCSYSMILGADLLAIPPLGAINIHGGLLPEYRGANILNWVLVEGARETGVTAHYMTARVDEGDIVLQEKTPVADTDTALTLKQRLDEIGFRMVQRILDELRAGRPLPREPQDPARVRLYRRRKPEDGEIDWSRSDRDIFNLVRALVKPWPGAFFTAAGGERVVLDRYLSMEEVAALRREHGR